MLIYIIVGFVAGRVRDASERLPRHKLDGGKSTKKRCRGNKGNPKKGYFCAILRNSLKNTEMFYVSDKMTTPPAVFATPLQKKVYKLFEELSVPFERVDTDPGITMEDCLNIDKRLGGKVVKSIFLCNRQQTLFYLYVTSGDKPFVTKDFGHALSIPRVSFAPADKLLEIAGTEHGATTVLSACLESARDVTFVMDRDITENECYCCSDGTVNCFIKIRTADLLGRFLPACGHELVVI